MLDQGDHYDKLENNITKMAREKRKFSPDFKAQVAMEACKGLDTVHTIAAKFEVHPVQVSTWKKQLQEDSAMVFATKRDRDPEDHAQKEARLYQKIGQLEVELDWLKKKSKQLNQMS